VVRLRGYPVAAQDDEDERSLAEAIAAFEVLEGRWLSAADLRARAQLARSCSCEANVDSCVAELEGPGSEPASVRGIPPGRYEVRVEIGNVHSQFILGAAPVDLAPGRCEQVLVRVDPGALDRRRVPLSGVLEIPLGEFDGELDFSSTDFELVGLDVGVPAGERGRYLWSRSLSAVAPGLFRWDAGTVAPGRWRVRCDRLQWEQEF
jgi:hypothetical protein